MTAGLLILLVLVVFGRTVSHEFVNYDDAYYVYENAAVSPGLTLAGLATMLHSPQHHDWVPLTALSHALDCQLYGLWAGGHHLTNVLLHAASSVLLLQALWRMTGLFWRSAATAAIFAIHPLNVESVAWVSARKDVLSGLFFMLVLNAYVAYTRQGGWGRYALVLLFIILGLMSKAMLITLPFLLLLLDVWPLRRLERMSRKALLLEKLPFLLPCLAVTWIGMQVNGPAAVLTQRFSLSLRVQNAVVSSVDYLRQTIWPTDLAVLYPYPEHGLSQALVLGSAAVLIAITTTAWLLRQSQPWWLIGWCWYVGLLVPVSGLLPPGEFARADRYTYLPQIGLGIAVVWTLAQAFTARRARRPLMAVAAALALSASAVLAFQQCSHWKNSETLWRHTLGHTPPNPHAHNNLGLALKLEGRKDEAIQQYRDTLQISPHHAGALYNLGNLLLEEGALDEALIHLQHAAQAQPGHARTQVDLGVALASKGQFARAAEHLQTAVRLSPRLADAHSNLANVLSQLGREEEAFSHYAEALKIEPAHADAHYNLGTLLSRQGQLEESIQHYQKAIAAAPGMTQAHNNLGIALTQAGRAAEALNHYETALRLKPDSADTCNNLAWLLATNPNEKLRNGARAVELARQAATLSPSPQPVILHTLAAAYAENAQFTEAVTTAGQALNLATLQGNQALAALLQTELEAYRQGLPWRDPSLR